MVDTPKVSAEGKRQQEGRTRASGLRAAPRDGEREEGSAFQPQFGADGLMTCVVTDSVSGGVLMVACMNREALERTRATGTAWFYSRSRRALWQKGERSGRLQRVVDMRVDCDQDSVWLIVEQIGDAACHTGRRSCFYRRVPLGTGEARLEAVAAERMFDPEIVYGVSD
jgi:phosphoribosyl-AMP cyclohydrolase